MRGTYTGSCSQLPQLLVPVLPLLCSPVPPCTNLQPMGEVATSSQQACSGTSTGQQVGYGLYVTLLLFTCPSAQTKHASHGERVGNGVDGLERDVFPTTLPAQVRRASRRRAAAAAAIACCPAASGSRGSASVTPGTPSSHKTPGGCGILVHKYHAYKAGDGIVQRNR